MFGLPIFFLRTRAAKRQGPFGTIPLWQQQPPASFAAASEEMSNEVKKVKMINSRIRVIHIDVDFLDETKLATIAVSCITC